MHCYIKFVEGCLFGRITRQVYIYIFCVLRLMFSMNGRWFVINALMGYTHNELWAVDIPVEDFERWTNELYICLLVCAEDTCTPKMWSSYVSKRWMAKRWLMELGQNGGFCLCNPPPCPPLTHNRRGPCTVLRTEIRTPLVLPTAIPSPDISLRLILSHTVSDLINSWRMIEWECAWHERITTCNYKLQGHNEMEFQIYTIYVWWQWIVNS